MRRGFTLVETIVTVVVVAAVTAISITVYDSVAGRARETAAYTSAEQFHRQLSALIAAGVPLADAYLDTVDDTAPDLTATFRDTDGNGYVNPGETITVTSAGGPAVSFAAPHEWGDPVVFSTVDPVVYETVVPNPPTSVTATHNQNGTVTVTWDTPADNGGVAPYDFVVDTRNVNGGGWVRYVDTITAATHTVLSGLTAGETFEVRVTAVNPAGMSTPSGVSNQVTRLPDMFGDPMVIPPVDEGNTWTVSFQATTASVEAGEPTPYNSYPHTLWWSYTPSVDQQMTFTTTSTGGRNNPTVYVGSSLSQLTSLSNTVACSTCQKTMSFTAGVTHRIRVAAAPGVTGITLSLTDVVNVTAPSNDMFASATVIAPIAEGGSWSETLNPAGAGLEPGEPGPVYSNLTNSVWWTYTPDFDQQATFTTVSTGNWNVGTVYIGADVATLTQMASKWACTTCVQTISFTAGVTYRIRTTTAIDTPSLTVSLTDVVNVTAPSNDMFASATVIAPIAEGGSWSETLNPAGAGFEPGEPGPVYIEQIQSVWWEYTPDFDQQATLTATSAGSRNTTAVYTGSDVSSVLRRGARWACTTCSFPVALKAGVTYRIRVDTPISVTSITVSITNVSSVTAPPNDMFAAATVIAPVANGGSWTDTISPPGSTLEPGEPGVYDNYLHSSWWEYTPDTSGQVTITVTSPGSRNQINVYTGTAVTSLTQIGGKLACTTCTLTVNLSAGVTYRIRIATPIDAVTADMTVQPA